MFEMRSRPLYLTGAGQNLTVHSRTLPAELATETDLEGFYRFLRNDAVTFEGVQKVHVTRPMPCMLPCCPLDRTEPAQETTWPPG
jgi:hypothetical protein